MNRCLAAVACATAIGWVSQANAQAPASPPAGSTAAADDARAEALFNAGKQLRDSGQLSEACRMFAESKQASPGVGIALHLGDCYERMGRTASALSEYREAETLANQRHDDKRAALAQARAQALEPKVGHLTLSTTGASHEGWQVLLDGVAVPSEKWNAPMAVDPGERVVTINAPGHPTRILKAQLDGNHLSAKLDLDEAEAGAAGGAAPTGGGPLGSSASEAAAADASSTTTPAPSHARLYAQIGLSALGVAGLGLGAAFLVMKNASMSNGTACDNPSVNNRDSVLSTVSFVVGGLALASVVVLGITAPGAGTQTGITMSPTAFAGGGGATVSGAF